MARPGCTFEDAVENIDIGGPAMVRAAAKNHERLTVVVDPLDYGTVLAEIDQGRTAACPQETRLRLATKAFAHTAQYDAAVASYLARAARPSSGEFPDLLALQFRKRLDLRYGENPHQQAAFYVAADTSRVPRSARLRSCRARNSRSTISPTPIRRSSASASSRRPPA